MVIFEFPQKLFNTRKKNNFLYTAQKSKFSTEGFFSKCDQFRSFLRIWSHLLKKFIMEKFIFCTVLVYRNLIHVSMGFSFPRLIYLYRTYSF